VPTKNPNPNTPQAAVCLLVDLVGSYKVSPEMRKKAVELRTRIEQEALKKVGGIPGPWCGRVLL
jgi:hypothetical protein